MEDVAIKVSGVSKNFKLPHEKVSSVKSIFTQAFRSIRKQRSFETQHALKDISFEIKKGEFFGIVGRNGSGKSTLLKILAGIYQPTKGSVKVSGKLVPFIELGVGFSPELTGRENVYLNGALLGFSEDEINKMYDDIVGFAELEQFMDQKLKNYSSGMQVRLAFSMAVRAKADILLIDEVLAVGDADFQRKCFNYFSKLKNQKTTVVFVSHDMNAVREYCDRAMLVEKNEVVDIGETDQISQKYLRLFMEDNVARDSTISGQDRWGDQTLRLNSVKADCQTKQISILTSFKAKTDFENPVVGLRIRDAAGNEVTGTNTKQENIKLPKLRKGDEQSVTFEFPNVLRDGEYTVDVALQYPDEITVADWWNGAAKLSVKKDRHLPYTVDPGFKITHK